MKFFKTLLSFFASAFFIGILLTFLMGSLCFLYYIKIDNPEVPAAGFYQALQTLHQKSIDWRLKARGLREGSEQVAVLAIDDKAISTVGRWPWSRDKMALIINQLKQYGAKAVAFDIVFSEKDQTSAGPALQQLKTRLQAAGAASSNVITSIDQEIEQANGDKKLADAIAGDADHLVLGSFSDPTAHAPFQEPCVDLYFQKSSVFRGWDHEALPLVVNENPLQLPDAFVPLIDQHLQGIATQRIISWLVSHQLEALPVRAAIAQAIGKQVNDELVARSVMGWFRQDPALLKQIAAMVNPAVSDDQIKNLMASLSISMDKLRPDLLEQKILEDQDAYCHSFLTSRDPLLREFEKTWPAVVGSNKDYVGLSFQSGIDKMKTENWLNPVREVGVWTMNIPQLQEKMKNLGVFDAQVDSDGVIRTNRLFSRTGTKYMASIGLKAFLLANNYNLKVTIQNDPKHAGYKTVSEVMVTNAETGDDVFAIPTDSQGLMMINYAGPQKMFPHLRASDLLTAGPKATVTQTVYDPAKRRADVQEFSVDKASFIKDKIFVFGVTAVGVFDMRVVPFEENYPGVETHANVIDNLLRRDFLKVSPQEPIFMPLVIVGLGLLLSYVLANLGAVAGFAVAASSLIALTFIDKAFIFKHGTVITIIFPLGLVSILYVMLTFYKYFTEERKKKELKGTFEKYVSPAIVQEILADPSNLELGGRKEVITVFFSDVRGFTTISEKLDPRSLSDLLNSYLTPMTRLVFEHKGTLDKYMGDAIMAFFGAPVHYPDHAKYACRCALAHLKKLKELQAEYERKGLPLIDIGIGLNTGEASVGNMGSDIVRNYTVMGDTVNLASRLEGINKQYGTRIIISEFTQTEVKNDFVTREVDRVRVKGKKQPVKIFELVAEGKVHDNFMDLLKWFEEGYANYHQKRWEAGIACFQNAINLNPQDAVSQLYLERCTGYLSEPPPEDWDGVFVMKTK